MSRKTLYIDIDSTIWDMESVVFATMQREFGIEITHEDITQWDTIPELVGWCDGWFDKCFKDAFDPEQVGQRRLYPHVGKALLNMWVSYGLSFHFLSHNPEPRKMQEPVRQWLHDHLLVPFEVTVFGARNDKINFMQDDPNAWGIVEDKPSTLAKAAKSEYVTIAKRHPYNLNIIDQYDILSFDHWRDVPDLVHNIVVEGEVSALG